jgi:putative hydrolase of the HAD superfamily
MRRDGRLVVLDVHGVVFSNPLVPYLAEMAGRYGREAPEVLQAWSTRLRRPFWLGHLSEAELWSSLFPGCDPVALSADLEGRYEAGPLFHRLDTIGDPIWLLSNHRSDWLLPRIARFGLEGRFERVYVSDAIGFVKPEPGAFLFVRELAGERTIRYLDDKPANVTVAATVFDEVLVVGQADQISSAPVA